MVSSNEIFSKYLGDQIRPRGQVASYPSRVVLTCSIIAEDCTITLRRCVAWHIYGKNGFEVLLFSGLVPLGVLEPYGTL